MSDEPDDHPGDADEPLEDILDDIIRLLGDDDEDRVIERMKADLATLGYGEPGLDTGEPAPPEHCGAGSCRAGHFDGARAMRDTDPRAAAREIVAAAQRTADEIIAAAQSLGRRYTEEALVRSARELRTTRRTGVPAVPVARHEAGRGDPPRSPTDAAAPEWAPPPTVLESGGDGGAGPLPPDATSIGMRWYDALSAAGVCFPVTRRAVARTLRTYAELLYAAARETPANTHRAHQVGVELVKFGVNQPAALASTLTTLAPFLADRDGGIGQPVLLTVAAIAAGYAEGLRDDVRLQQESLHRATLDAAHQSGLSLRSNEARYQRITWFDPLTGLANRTLVLERLAQALARPDNVHRHIGLCLIDLVGFKSVNNRFGADTGDRVLSAVAHRLQSLTADTDYLLARCGSDEFAIMVENSAGTAHLVDLAERVAAAFGAPVLTAGVSVLVQPRAGIVCVPVTAGVEAHRMLFDAEAAVGRARHDNTLWAVHDPSRWGSAAARTALPAATDLHAVPLAYQSIVRLHDVGIAGVQARARWRHPHLGDLDVRRIGDLTGSRTAVRELSASLLHQVCHQGAQWQSNADPPYVSVDLPLHQIGYPDVLELVHDALTSSGLHPTRLQIELSGVDAVPAADNNYTILAALADLGVRIALNDFGTGHTNLAYVRDLPIHDLRTPARLLTCDSTLSTVDDRGLLAAMATMAHSMGLTLTVYDVDAPQHATALAGTGCDHVQGHHYGEVVDAVRTTAELNAQTTATPPEPPGRREPDDRRYDAVTINDC